MALYELLWNSLGGEAVALATSGDLKKMKRPHETTLYLHLVGQHSLKCCGNPLYPMFFETSLSRDAAVC